MKDKISHRKNSETYFKVHTSQTIEENEELENFKKARIKKQKQ